LFLRVSRGARWACVDEALCDYRLHPGQSHERLTLVHDVARQILDRQFADPRFPAALRPSESAAYESADLRAAAEFHAAGSVAHGDVALGRAVARRPAILGEPRTMLQVLRLMLPDGFRGRDELIRRRTTLEPVLHAALLRVARSRWERNRSRRTMLAVAWRLHWRAFRRRVSESTHSPLRLT